MKVGDVIMTEQARVVAVATALSVALGLGVVGAYAAATVPVIEELTAETGPEGPVIALHASGGLDTVHYSPQPGVWVVEMPEAHWEESRGVLSDPDLGIERAELTRVEEFGKQVTRLTVWLVEPAQLSVVPGEDGVDLRFELISSLAADAEEQPVAAATDEPERTVGGRVETAPAVPPPAEMAPDVEPQGSLEPGRAG